MSGIKEFVKEYPIADIKPHPNNPRIHPDSAIEKLQRSIQEFGFVNPVLLTNDGLLLAGHARIKASTSEGLEHVPALVLNLDGAKADAYLIADNKLQEETEWDLPVLKELLEELENDDFPIELTGFELPEIDELIASFDEDFEEDEDELSADDGENKEEANKTLAERFGVPPFTVLDSRQGYWTSRKRAWLDLGIKSELGRGESADENKGNNKVSGVLFKSDSGRDPSYYSQKRKIEEKLGHEISTAEFQEKYYEPISSSSSLSSSGTSVFDPVLCELAYTWFSPSGGKVLDPFSGGSVRGIVAARLGREYYGVDLREEQIKANREQAESIEGLKAQPTWFVGDSTKIDSIVPEDLEADFVFSCPPYADLEVYSDNPEDLSTMSYEDFVKAYRVIIKKAVDKLKDNSFACFVVGDVRDKQGFYRNFVSDTISAFRDAGMHYYNECIFVTTVGSLAIRVAKPFAKFRKLGKTHQNVLVFYKGDPKKIPERLGEIEVENMLEQPDDVHAETMEGVEEY